MEHNINIRYGKIDDVQVLFEDHGCLIINCFIKLQGGSFVTFGNVSLGNKNDSLVNKTHKLGDPTNYCGYYIAKLCNTFDIDNLNDLKGQSCRAIFDGNLCIGIQNFMNLNKYFIPREDFLGEEKELYNFSPIFN